LASDSSSYFREDGSSLLIVELNNAALQKAGILSLLNATEGLQQITQAEGITYSNFLEVNQFTPIDETSYCNLLESLLKNSTEVFFYGQVYHDTTGAVGIHDIHEITGINGYGDGGFITVDADSNYYGIFAHFNDQPGVQIIQ